MKPVPTAEGMMFQIVRRVVRILTSICLLAELLSLMVGIPFAIFSNVSGTSACLHLSAYSAVGFTLFGFVDALINPWAPPTQAPSPTSH